MVAVEGTLFRTPNEDSGRSDFFQFNFLCTL